MKKREAQITEQELQQAIHAFLDEGGLIAQLPEEVEPLRLLVGAKYATYENPLDFAYREAYSA